MNKKQTDDINFFKELLNETEIAFRQSHVYKKFKEKKWGYSITATKFQKHKPLILGFNWGAGKNWQKDHKEEQIQHVQNYQLLKSFKDSYNTLGSFKKVVNLFDKYLPRANNGVQTNFCFFRSYKENQITLEDIKLCTPLFEKLVDYLEPSEIITFSRYLNNYFDTNNKIIDKKVKNIKSNNKTINTTKGSIMIKGKKIDYYNLPHPNYPITTKARTDAWDFCFPINNE